MKLLDYVLLIGLTVLTALAIIFVSVSTTHAYPEVSNIDTNESICYVETENGRILDLSGMCGKTPEVISPENPAPAPANFKPEPTPRNAPPQSSPTNFKPEPTPRNVPPQPPPANFKPQPTPRT